MVGPKNLTTVVEAAMRLFSRHGYSGTSTKAIALEAGVKEPEIYRLFLNKEKLFLECVTIALGRSLEPSHFLTAISGELLAAPFCDLVGHAVRTWYSSLPGASARLLMHAALSDNKTWSKLVFSRIDRIIRILGMELEKELRVSKSDAMTAASALILALFQYKISRPLLPSLQKESEIVANMINQCLRSLSPDSTKV